MADDRTRVAAVVRHREAILVYRAEPADEAVSLPTAVVTDSDPEVALRTLLGELGVGTMTVERRGTAVETSGGTLIPFLVSADARTATTNGACPAPSWELPSVLRRQADDATRRAYDAVTPTVETVAEDAERGSTAIATDALWVLRDAASWAAETDADFEAIGSVAADLLETRPTMAALANRVNRAMTGAATATDIERAATDGIIRAMAADEDAAALAAESVANGRVLTLSRSGTVRAALLAAEPEVVVLASRPGGEGLDVASELSAAGLEVSTCPDADVYEELRSGVIDAVLVGTDAVTPDGVVVNKVGTRAAALAAERAGVPVYAVCASDKIRPASGDDEDDVPLPVEPMFDHTPPRLVTALFTERGRLAPDDVRAIAEEHRALAAWRNRDVGGVEKG